MFKFLRDEKYQLFWFIFHAALGIACVFSKFFLIGWFYFITVSLIINVFLNKNTQISIICYLSYALGFEVLSRGVGAPPFIPHEVGKYITFAGFFLGILTGGPIKRTSIYGVAMLLLSIPAILIMPKFEAKPFVFNYLGPLALFLGVIFCSKQILTYTNFKEVMRIMVYSIFTLACYTIFRASTFEKVEYTLAANYDAAGGSITNQVATLFGTAICIIMIMYLTRQTLFKYKWMDISLLILFTIRGLLTFSRGGMVSAVLALIVIVLMPKAKEAWQDSEIKFKKISASNVLIIIGLLLGSFFFVNSMTDNMLTYRYQGRTQRSLETGFTNTITVNEITTGRVDIMITDLKMFMAYPALGVGVGQSRILRPQYGDLGSAAAHLELSRLLAEHGFLGLILVIMIYIYPFIKLVEEPNNYKRIIMVVFLVMALSASLHNAMRTMISPLLFAFCFLYIVPDSYDWRTHLKTKKRYMLGSESPPKPEPVNQSV